MAPGSLLHRPYLRAGSRDESILLEIPVFLRPFKGKMVIFFFFYMADVLGLFSVAAARDFAILLLLLYFSLPYGVMFQKNVVLQLQSRRNI